MSLAYLQAMAAQDIIGRIIGVYLPALAFEAIGMIFALHGAAQVYMTSRCPASWPLAV